MQLHRRLWEEWVQQTGASHRTDGSLASTKSLNVEQHSARQPSDAYESSGGDATLPPAPPPPRYKNPNLVHPLLALKVLFASLKISIRWCHRGEESGKEIFYLKAVFTNAKYLLAIANLVTRGTSDRAPRHSRVISTCKLARRTVVTNADLMAPAPSATWVWMSTARVAAEPAAAPRLHKVLGPIPRQWKIFLPTNIRSNSSKTTRSRRLNEMSNLVEGNPRLQRPLEPSASGILPVCLESILLLLCC